MGVVPPPGAGTGHEPGTPLPRAAAQRGNERQPVKQAAAPIGWRASLRHRCGALRGDLAGGVTAALVLPAVEGSYGLVAFAALGPDLVPLGFLLGALTAAAGTLVTLLAGGRGPLLSGCSAALALLTASLIGWLIADARFTGADGRPLLPLLLSFVGLGLVLAGVLQVAAARLRLGALVRYIPYPVYAGYMIGVALLMVIAMLPHLAGLPPGAALSSVVHEPQRLQWLAPVVAAVALWFSLKPRAGTGRLPAYLSGLLAAALLHHALARTPLAGELGPLFEAPAFAWPRADTLAPVLQHLGDGLLADKIGVVLLFAAAVALMSTLQSTLSASVVDELTHARRDGDRELQAQGVANIVLGAIGALPSAGATARSKVSLDAGACSSASRAVFAVALLLVLIFGLRFMHLLPLAAIAGVFVALAASMVDAWSRGAVRVVLRRIRQRGPAGRIPPALLQSCAVMLLVAGVTVFVSLALAVFLGVLVAMVLFIRSNCRPPIRRVAHADRRRSRKIRPAQQAALLTQHGARIALVEFDGALFFGTAQEADAAIEALARGADTIVLDFERVSEVDASAARMLLRAADALAGAGKRLLLSGLALDDLRARSIQDMDVHARLAHAQIFADADRALEFAEDRLLDTLAPAAAAHAPLPLAHTLLGSGLGAQELAVLAGLLVERRFARGDLIFRRGDPGDVLYVLLQGQVGIWLHAPAADADAAARARSRRLVSYAPGVVFGEMGLMHGQPRSADAVAEEATVVLELARAAYDALARDHAVLLGKLLLGINGLLGARVRALTGELEAALAAP